MLKRYVHKFPVYGVLQRDTTLVQIEDLAEIGFDPRSSGKPDDLACIFLKSLAHVLIPLYRRERKPRTTHKNFLCALRTSVWFLKNSTTKKRTPELFKITTSVPELLFRSDHPYLFAVVRFRSP